VSDHNDTPDPRTDITDLYVFRAPGGGDRSVFVLCINPKASSLEPSFDPAASYELKIDTDGDLEADVSFQVVFASFAGGVCTATVYRSTGAAARETGAIGDGEYESKQLGRLTISASPPTITEFPLSGDPTFMAVDGAGRLWLTEYDQDTVIQVDLGSGIPVMTVAVTLPGGTGPRGLVFDGNGSLWVAEGNGRAVDRFDQPGVHKH